MTPTLQALVPDLNAFGERNIADAIELLNGCDLDDAIEITAQLPLERAIDMFDRPELQRAGELIARLPDARAADLLEGMADDRAADVLLELDEADRARLSGRLRSGTLEALRRLMRYAPRTAGSLMTTEFVSVRSDWTVAQTLAHIRRVERSRETVYAIYLLDPDSHALERMVSLRRLVAGEPSATALSVAQRSDPVWVSATTNQEEVARLIRRHDLLAIPVLDEARHVLGVVTVDDVLDALIAEGTEDAHKFGGLQANHRPYLQTGFWAMIRKRAGWLSALFLGEMLTASAMQHFDNELAKAVMLTLFIPLIMSSGGNSGSQATSLLIRSLALGELRLRDWWKVALRELPTGMLLGAMLGAVAIIRIMIWQYGGIYDYGPHWLLLAFTVAAALVGIVTFGSLTGSMLPFALQRLGFDPASASAPFVATLVDVTGLVIYFSIAALILGGTLL